MKFFDYKFLILLSLTLTVYFIYIEVEYLHNKINKLEHTISNHIPNHPPSPILNHIPCHNLIPDPQPSPQPSPPPNPQPSPQPSPPLNPIPNISYELHEENIINYDIKLDNTQSDYISTTLLQTTPKIINIDLKPTSVSELNITSNDFKDNKNHEIYIDNIDMKNDSQSYLQNKVQKKINDIIEQAITDTNSDVITASASESSKHLAIYSNDNEQFNESHNSLLESIKSNKNDLNFNHNRKEIQELNETIDNKNSSIDEIIEEKEKQLDEQGNQELNEQGNQELNEQGNQELNEQGNQELNEQGNQELNEQGNQELNEQGNQELNEQGNQELNEQGNQELNEQGNQELNEQGNQELNESILNNMKLPKIKKIAEQNKITITKKVKGQYKSKNKNELITEILTKVIKSKV
jgi:hypothetical protein